MGPRRGASKLPLRGIKNFKDGILRLFYVKKSKMENVKKKRKKTRIV